MEPASEFSAPARDQKPVAIGECQRLANLLERHPSACIMSLEQCKDRQGLDVVIGLNGTASKPIEYIRTNPDLLLGTFVWCEIRSKQQLPQMQKLIRKASMLMSTPMMPVH